MVLSDMKKLGHRCCLLVVINLATCFACASGSFVCTPTPHPHSRCHFPSPACYISIKQTLTGNRGTPGRVAFWYKLAGKGAQRWLWGAIPESWEVLPHIRSAQACLFLWPKLYDADGPTGPFHTLLGCVLDVRFRDLQCQKPAHRAAVVSKSCPNGLLIFTSVHGRWMFCSILVLPCEIDILAHIYPGRHDPRTISLLFLSLWRSVRTLQIV